MEWYAMARRHRKQPSLIKTTFASIGASCNSLLAAIFVIFKSPITIAWIITVGGLITLTALSVPSLRATRIAAKDLIVTFNNPPEWLDESLLTELQDLVRSHLASVPVGRQGLIKASNALEGTGWFASVNQVSWLDESHAEVNASFLIPHAQVNSKNGNRFIDPVGIVLPKRNGRIVSSGYHFVTLNSPKHLHPQRPGLRWDGGDIIAGLQVLRLIYDKPWALQVEAIDLSRWSSDGSLTLITDTPCRLKWGSAPGQEVGLEALADDKLLRLDQMHRDHGAIDLGRSANLDLTHPDKVAQIGF
ncbi:MAG: hypothetical protein QF444_05970 [Phycisphaerales bacterium]|jgi:hypothetical protein|nr:hypothetical protein [Phycisphaerales bacterium]